MDATTQWIVTVVCVCSFGLGLLAGRDLKSVFTTKELRAQLDLKVGSAVDRACDRVRRELSVAKFRS